MSSTISASPATGSIMPYLTHRLDTTLASGCDLTDATVVSLRATASSTSIPANALVLLASYRVSLTAKYGNCFTPPATRTLNVVLELAGVKVYTGGRDPDRTKTVAFARREGHDVTQTNSSPRSSRRHRRAAGRWVFNGGFADGG